MRKRAAIVLYATVLVALVILPTVLCYRECPTRDSGGALYAGWRILEGDILYRDVWDHKSPAIYFIDAFGLLISGGSIWGVICLEFMFLVCAALLGFVLIREVFGIVPAFFATTAWMLSLILVHEGGNLPEEYALLFQFSALFLFVRSEEAGCYSWRGVLIGLAGGLAFSLRPNLTGIWCAILIFLLWGSFASTARLMRRGAIAAILLGFVGGVLPFVIYFVAHGNLAGALDAIFIYNIAYSGTSMHNRLTALIGGLCILRRSGLGLTALLGWIGGCIFLCRGKNGSGIQAKLVQLAVVAFPIELVCACIAGRCYPHYYIAWLPIFAVLSGFFAYGIIGGAFPDLTQHVGDTAGACGIRSAALVVLLGVMGSEPVGMLFHKMRLFSTSRDTRAKKTAVEYIKRVTGPDETVLIWGAEPSLNFLSVRKSPSRYSFQYPLYTRGYGSATVVRRFLDDLIANEPTLIIDTSSSNALIPPIDSVKRRRWRSPSDSYLMIPETEILFKFITGRYRQLEDTGVCGWTVYRRKGLHG